MKKALVLCVCFAVLGLNGIVGADNVGLGFEWSQDWVTPLQTGFTGSIGTNGAIDWMVGDNLSFGIFTQTVQIRGSHNYTAATGPLDSAGNATNIKYELVENGSMMSSGIRFLYLLPISLPVVESLGLGFDFGAATFNTNNTYTQTGSTNTITGGSPVDFGQAGATPLMGVTPLLGLQAKLVLLSAKSKGIWTDINLGLGMHFTSFNDVYALGKSETSTPAPTPLPGTASPVYPSIDPIKGFNSFDLALGVTIGF